MSRKDGGEEKTFHSVCFIVKSGCKHPPKTQYDIMV